MPPLLPNMMQNGLEMLRLKNIFQPEPSPTFPTPMGPQPTGPMAEVPNIPYQVGMPMQEQPFDVTSRMKELYQPQTTASDRFNEMMAGQPKWEKPGVWRSIAAALSAFGPGGHDTGMKVAQQPYLTKMADWKSGIEPAYQAANLERQENINARQLAHNTVQGELTMRRDEARTKQTETQNKIRQQRADAYSWKTRNPNKQLKEMNGTMHVFDPGTGKHTDTGIPADIFSAAEKQELDYKQEQAIERIEAGGKEARKTETTRQSGREEIGEMRGWKPYQDKDGNIFMYNEITGETRDRTSVPVGAKPTQTGAGGTGRPELPSQTKVRHYNAAKEFADRYPELGQWITFGAGNTFKIKPPKTGTFGTGPSPTQHKMMQDAIYGAEGPPQEESSQGNKFPSSGPGGGRGGNPSLVKPGPRFSPSSPPPAPPGWRYVPKQGGGWTAVPAG